MTLVVDCIAHRGFAARSPENTLPAVRAAARRADAVEVDVRPAATGEPVVVHDATLERVAGVDRPVAALDADALAELSVLDSDAGVPTLERVIEAVPSDVALVLDCKERAVAGPVAERALGCPQDVLLSAFDDRVLQAAREATPAVDRALLDAGDREDPVVAALDLDCAALHLRADACDRALVSAAEGAGLAVNAWDVGDRATARSLADRGVDGLIVDDPVVLEGFD